MVYTICSGCGREIPQGERCPSCSKEGYRNYNKYKRDVKSAKFYNSPEWIQLRNYINRKYNWICVKCLVEEVEIRPVDAVHHIEPVKSNYKLRLKEDNLIPLCSQCHNRIDHNNYTEKEKEELREILIEYKNIYG